MAGRRIALRWSATELDMLADMTGNSPWPVVVQSYNQWARNNGHPTRTERALAHKAHELCGSRLSVGRWIGVGDAARALGRWPSTVWDWSNRGLIKRYRLGTASAVSRDDLIKLARTQPHLFGGATREGLMQVLEDPELVDDIRSRFPKKAPCFGGRRRISCCGVVYESIAAAARAHHVRESAIRAGLLECRRVAGLEFRAVD